METKQQRAEKLKLLNEMSKAYSRGDKLKIENRILKKEIQKLKKQINLLNLKIRNYENF